MQFKNPIVQGSSVLLILPIRDSSVTLYDEYKWRLLGWLEVINLKVSRFYYDGKAAAAAAKSLQSGPTLCDPIDSSPPDSAIPGILQARILQWVMISFSNAWKWQVKGKSLRVQLLATPWTAAYQAPPSMGFSRQEYWSGVPLSSLVEKLGKPKSMYIIFKLPTSVGS